VELLFVCVGACAVVAVALPWMPTRWAWATGWLLAIIPLVGAFATLRAVSAGPGPGPTFAPHAAASLSPWIAAWWATAALAAIASWGYAAEAVVRVRRHGVDRVGLAAALVAAGAGVGIAAYAWPLPAPLSWVRAVMLLGGVVAVTSIPTLVIAMRPGDPHLAARLRSGVGLLGALSLVAAGEATQVAGFTQALHLRYDLVEAADALTDLTGALTLLAAVPLLAGLGGAAASTSPSRRSVLEVAVAMSPLLGLAVARDLRTTFVAVLTHFAGT
jgi:hypothetical protein